MEIILRNMMEDVVINKLDKLIDQLDCCKCDRCRLDIASYALNRLPTKYIATTQGEIISRLDYMSNEFDMSVTAAIVSASMVIKKHPRHDAAPLDKLPIVK